ncbi:MAG: histone deacetylase [Pseudomonadota bacterium]
MLPIVHHPDYLAPLRPGHRFPMSKYGYVREALIGRGLLSSGGYLAPAAAGRGQIELAHAPAYVDRVFSGMLTSEEVRRIGLPQTSQVVMRSRLSSAGTTLAAWMAIEHGIACNSAGGSHHAGPDYGAGFCLLNDVAVAICNYFAQGLGGPVLVVDADVHQGDGTARIFQDHPGVFTLSIHAARNFPARKATSSMDIALPDGTGDAEYLAALAPALDQAFTFAEPRLVFYNAGVDVHRDDKLGRLSLSLDGIRARDACVLAAARDRNVPIVGVLGGGYSDDPVALADRHAILFEEAARIAG